MTMRRSLLEQIRRHPIILSYLGCTYKIVIFVQISLKLATVLLTKN